MAAGALVETKSFATADPDVAREVLGAAYGDNRLRIVQPIVDDGVLSIEERSGPELSVNSVASPAELVMPITGDGDIYHFSTLAQGVVEVDHRGWNGEHVTTSGPGDTILSICPGVEWVHIANPAVSTSVGISEARLREAGGLDHDDSSLGWEPLSARPIPGREPLWNRALELAETVLSDPASATAPLVVAETERMVATAALHTFPNRLVEPDDRGGVASKETVNRAVAFIDSNLHRDVGLAEIATAAAASPRALSRAFRRQLDTTPKQYLLRARLDQIRMELRAASPRDGTTVASVAAKWGYGASSLLAKRYAQAFGETPRDTLRRD